MKRLRIHPFTPLLLLLGWVTHTLPMMLGMYAALLIHESGHLLAAAGFKMGVSYLGILPFGIVIRLNEEHRRGKNQRILVAAAGPIASFLGAAVIFLCRSLLPEAVFSFLFCANLCLGAFNLLPISNFDGGRILFYLLSDAFGSIIGYHRVLFASWLCIAAMAALGGAVLYTTRWNPSLLMISCFFCYKLWAESGYERLTMTQNAIDYRRKPEGSGVFPARTLAVREDVPLRRLLKYFSASRYCIVHIVDRDMKLKTTLTEQQIADALVQAGGTITGEHYETGSTTQAGTKALPLYRRRMGQHSKG